MAARQSPKLQTEVRILLRPPITKQTTGGGEVCDMTTQEKAYNDYVKGLKYKEIAKKYGVSVNTVKSWQRRYDWKREKGAHKKMGAPFFNTNAVGAGAPAGNQNAATHGLFAKYLPEETMELVEAFEQKKPIDILWENICLKYAAIVRAQRIMFVRDAEDVTKRHTLSGDDADAYEYKEAYEKQAVFLQAQSRAMGTLNNMIRQYEEMCRQGQVDEEQQLRIAKLKAEVAELNTDKQAETVTFTFNREEAHTDGS